MEGRNELYVGGDWRAPTSSEPLRVISPHSGELLATAPAAGPDDVDRAVAAARSAQDEGDWPSAAPADRAAAVRKLIEAYAERRRDMASLITAEMGAPISFSKFAQAMLPMVIMSALPTRRHLPVGIRPARRVRRGHDRRARSRPGVVAAIVPWNMPQFLIATKLAPGPARRVLHRHQAGRARRRSMPCCWPRSSTGSASPPAWSASSPAGATSASCSSPTPGSTRSRSPAPPPPGARWPPAAARTSSGSAWSWAASRRPSCSTTPTRRSPRRA